MFFLHLNSPSLCFYIYLSLSMSIHLPFHTYQFISVTADLRMHLSPSVHIYSFPSLYESFYIISICIFDNVSLFQLIILSIYLSTYLLYIYIFSNYTLIYIFVPLLVPIDNSYCSVFPNLPTCFFSFISICLYGSVTFHTASHTLLATNAL